MPHLVLGTAGHIDHGKSTLVRALTGTDPDRLKEEKARGITIDLGFAHWRDGDVGIAFVDVPGHERFVRNMLAGAGGIDAVLLVVAADESVMPQTREHFEVCRLLGLERGVVALTKADLVDEDTLGVARLEVGELVAGSPLAGMPVLPVSAATGRGLDDLRDALRALASSAPSRDDRGAARLPIDRVFTMRGFGTVVTGTLVAGRLAEGDDLAVLPGGPVVKVRGLQVHGQPQPSAAAGHRVAVNLAGVDVEALARGQVLAAPRAFVETTTIDAAIELLPDARPLGDAARIRFHQGTAEVMGRISTPRPEGAGREGMAIAPGSRGHARIRLEAPAMLARGDRFILRSYSPVRTIGGGRVLDPHAPRGSVRAAGAHERFARLALGPGPIGPDDEATLTAAAALVEEAGPRGLPVRALTTRLAVARTDREAVVERLRGRGAAEAIGDRLFRPSWREVLGERLVRALAAHHDAHPLSEGLPREEARERVLRDAAPALAERVLADAESAGTISGRGSLALRGRGISLSADEARARQALEARYREAGLQPPDVASLARELGLAPDVVDRVAALLVRQRVLARLDTVLFHQEALDRLKREVAALRPAEGSTNAKVDVAAFKERYGVSRKFAIPLLEFLDRERVTRRVGDTRVVLAGEGRG